MDIINQDINRISLGIALGAASEEISRKDDKKAIEYICYAMTIDPDYYTTYLLFAELLKEEDSHHRLALMMYETALDKTNLPQNSPFFKGPLSQTGISFDRKIIQGKLDELKNKRKIQESNAIQTNAM